MISYQDFFGISWNLVDLCLEIRIFRQLSYYTVVNLFIQKYISLQNDIHMVLKLYNNLFNNRRNLSNRLDKSQMQ